MSVQVTDPPSDLIPETPLQARVPSRRKPGDTNLLADKLVTDSSPDAPSISAVKETSFRRPFVEVRFFGTLISLACIIVVVFCPQSISL